MKLVIAIITSKILIVLCRILNNGGTTLPGKIANKIYPNILKTISEHFRIIMVTGTNGKTTTTKIISHILKENNINFITNNSGANLLGGVITTLIQGITILGKPKKSIALLEVDEAAFLNIADFVEPQILVVTNFFRDQLDRYGELYTTLKNVKTGIEKLTNTRLILNADDSLCASLGKDTDKQVFYYGFKQGSYKSLHNSISSDSAFCIFCKEKYTYSFNSYGHLGHFSCNNCGYSRPSSDVTCTKVKKLSSNYSQIKTEIKTPTNKILKLDFKINLPGAYNIYNGLAAISLSTLLDLPYQNTIKALSTFESGFGRMETINISGKIIKLILVKNPAGFDQVLNLLVSEKKSFNVAFLLNDNLADGTDISWIWDVNFEMLQGSDRIKSIFTSGTRAEDMSLRLKYAGAQPSEIENNYKSLITKGIETSDIFYILPTYTAMLKIRNILKKKFKLKEFWK